MPGINGINGFNGIHGVQGMPGMLGVQGMMGMPAMQGGPGVQSATYDLPERGVGTPDYGQEYGPFVAPGQSMHWGPFGQVCAWAAILLDIVSIRDFVHVFLAP